MTASYGHSFDQAQSVLSVLSALSVKSASAERQLKPTPDKTDSSLINNTMRAIKASQHYQMRKQFWEEKAAAAMAAVSLSTAVGDTSAGKNSSGTSDSRAIGDRSAGGVLK